MWEVIFVHIITRDNQNEDYITHKTSENITYNVFKTFRFSHKPQGHYFHPSKLVKTKTSKFHDIEGKK
jgi:hypothetical protein